MSGSSLRILISNLELWPRTGTATYVRDLALELKRQGQCPAVYTLKKGPIADELAGVGIPVVDSLDRFAFTPQVIHGHHLGTTMSVVERLRGVPAVSVCHDHLSRRDRTVPHPRIRRYFGVSQLCVSRLLREGAPAARTRLLPNSVDTERFLPRSRLPNQPRRALVFSNYASATTHLPAVREACRREGLQLDVVGSGNGNPIDEPEKLLGNYDIVFAKARAALEAMCVGTAVVLCDSAGVGPMVTSSGFDRLQIMNFGVESLVEPLNPDAVLRQIARYDAADAARVQVRLRSTADLKQAVGSLIHVYRDVIEEQSGASVLEAEGSGARHLLLLRLYVLLARAWMALTPRQRARLDLLPGMSALKHATTSHLLETR